MDVIIIDDEEHARENLKRRLLKIDANINIVDMVGSATEAFISINNNEPDLVFIDIEMPEGDGFSLLERFKSITFDVIFVTAYNEHALRAFELLAIGYITKPIDNELLSRVYHRSLKNQSTSVNRELLDDLAFKIEKLSKSTKVAIPSEKGVNLIESDSIIMLQSSDGYTGLHLDTGNIVLSSKRLKHFEEILTSNFIRMHKSTIVNVNFIKKYYNAGIVILINGQELPVGRKYKRDMEKLINK